MATAPTSAYVVVHDIAASWHDYYHRLARTVDDTTTPGLLLHAAGPTDEGFRTVDVWRDECTWQHQRDRWLAALHPFDTPPVVRGLSSAHLVMSHPPTSRSIP
jgi:hypothetical protein